MGFPNNNTLKICGFERAQLQQSRESRKLNAASKLPAILLVLRLG
jgi:hypothetical protein